MARRAFRPLPAALLIAAAVLPLVACSSTQQQATVAPSAAGAGAADAGAAAPRAPEAVAAPAVVAAERALIKSSAALLAVADLTAAHDAVIRIVAQSDGIVVSEYVSKGGTPEPTPEPKQAMSSGGVADSATTATSATVTTVPGWDRFPDYVDVSFTVPAAQFEAAVARVRALGDVVQVQQDVTDVTPTVADLDARVATARASLVRVRDLLARAATIEQVLTIEKELTVRQANLESLQAQQRALASQVSRSTISVRLVPADAVAAWTGAEPSWWSSLWSAAGSAWRNVLYVVVVASPVWLLGGLAILLAVWWWRRRRARRGLGVDTAGTTA